MTPVSSVRSPHLVTWQEETKRYDRPHPRLVLMSRLLRALPQRRLLDVGCSTGIMRSLLPADFEYFGCDIADHARRALDAEHFRQLDLNRSCDLAPFANRGINVVHIGGVLEYLQRPAEVVERLHALVDGNGRMVVSIINFEAFRYARPETHHAGWIYKPTLDQMRQLLRSTGWRIDREVAFLDRDRLRDSFFRLVVKVLGTDHAWVRRHARQFILTATAR